MESTATLSTLGLTPQEIAKAERHEANPFDGIWIFIVGDLFIFGSYFVTYALWRNWQHAIFLDAQRNLSLGFGLFNTMVLLISSWFVAGAIKAMRAGNHDAAGWLTLGTMGWGLVFVVSKIAEWSVEVGNGFVFTSNMFSQFYFWTTGVHILHVFFGLMALFRLYLEVRDPACRNPATAESAAAFWHMVDLLWLVIFALMYLMR
jgi:nitric oxide reductase NorE protein